MPPKKGFRGDIVINRGQVVKVPIQEPVPFTFTTYRYEYEKPVHRSHTNIHNLQDIRKAEQDEEPIAEYRTHGHSVNDREILQDFLRSVGAFPRKESPNAQ